MEERRRPAILATNLRRILDDALVQRGPGLLLLPFPDAELRRASWEFAFAGGDISDVTRTAAFPAPAHAPSRDR